MDTEFSASSKGTVIGPKAKLNQHNNEVGRQVNINLFF